MKKIILILVLLTVSINFGQDKKVKKANDNFENFAFMDAISSYEDLVKDGLTDEEIFKKLGNANYVNAVYDSAAEWYGKLVKLENVDIEPGYYYRYAQSLKSEGAYDESNKWMEKFNATKSNDQRAKNYSSQEDYLEQIKKNSGRYTLKNLLINSEVSDFAPSYRGEQLIFSTARDTGIAARNIHQWNKGAFLNLHVTQITDNEQMEVPTKFSKMLNTKTHESSSVFTKDGNTIYFTRNNSQNGKFARDGQGVSRLKIYKSTFVNGAWEKPKALPFNSADFSVAHPALSEDEKTLYFSSNMPGTLGASDIFKVAINEDGSYSEPENLGNKVNTEARETFPSVQGNILYFSSDGHPGLGGLDVFATEIDASTNEVLNLGEPLNSKQDDFSYIIDASGKGYFASNRDGGKGKDDIYSFVESTALKFECVSSLLGIVNDKSSTTGLANARVLLMLEDNIIKEVTTDANGEFNLQLDCNNDAYIVTANKEEYSTDTQTITIENSEAITVTLTLEQIVKPKAEKGTDLVKYLKLESINFDLDKSNIRPDAQVILNQVYEYLITYPETKISIASHTDAKASTSYNQKLSEKRAISTLQYLVAKGIPKERLEAKGFGENNLLNDCKIWENCSNQENERNRRSEIIIKN